MDCTNIATCILHSIKEREREEKKKEEGSRSLISMIIYHQAEGARTIKYCILCSCLLTKDLKFWK